MTLPSSSRIFRPSKTGSVTETQLGLKQRELSQIEGRLETEKSEISERLAPYID